MILEFDLGNSRCKWRLRTDHEVVARGHLLTATHFNELDIPLDLHRLSIKRVLCVSVVSEAKEREMVAWCESFLGITPEFARVAPAFGKVVNGYVEPSTLGADRWVGIVCAHNRFHNSLILVSFGTAITVDLILRCGRHLGGFIAPGINLMLSSLVNGTCRVAIDEFFSVASLQPGIATSGAVHSAVTAMLMGLVGNGITQLQEMEPESKMDIVFTGGDAGKFLSLYPEAQFLPDLTLDGLSYVFNNSKNTEQ